MRWILAAVLMIGLVGCGEKKPTAAERAAVYMAAKAELEMLEKQRSEMVETYYAAERMGAQFSEKEKADFKQACENSQKMIDHAKQVMTENGPATY